ncbi:MAG: preprotein translocase subunit SecY [Methanomassiliicoccaceae archaeon]|nr:preprotein translocase subunit SecY [Methanomassiliicoccaceae archaeon]
MEENKSLLYRFKPVADRLPAVKRPEGHVHFRTKMMWVILIVVIYFFMTNVYIYGLDQENTMDLFAQYRTIMAGASGSLLHLGIGPIVTASIIMQLFVGAKIIKLDLTNREDKACYQSFLKLLVIMMIVVEAVPQVFGYLEPSNKFVNSFGLGGARGLIVLQLFIGSYIVFLMDEVVSKWGIGSGISLFIAAGVSESLFTGTVNWNPVNAAAEVSMSNLPAGTIPKTIYLLGNIDAGSMANGGYELLLLGGPNPLIALVGTIIIFLIVAYLESTRIELPLSHGSARGARGRYPIKLIYASNIPVILMMALLANISMFALLFYTNPGLSGIPLLGNNDLIGYFHPGETHAAGGFAWYVSAPMGLTSWLLPVLQPEVYGDGLHGPIQQLMRVVIYFTVMVLGSIMFAKFWISTTNMGAESVANQIQKSGMQIPGFRRDPRVLRRVLERYIPVVTVLSGAIVGAIAAGADLIGTTGNASGTGVLLTVGILIQFYEAMGREQMMEMHPVMRGFFGEDR